MGPLASLKVILVDAQGSASVGASYLASLGAKVLRLDRLNAENAHHVNFAEHVGGDWVDPRQNTLSSAQWSVDVDLKNKDAAEVVLRLAEGADIIIEGFRPGVAERLGIGPDACLKRNPRLVYLRATGWGQTGPLANVPGHDINYIAIAGALDPIGFSGSPPVPPLNLLGDVAGGLHAAFGALAAVFEARLSGKGQVVDAAMLDSAAMFMKVVYMMHSMGAWSLTRGENLMDTGAPFYGVYETADGKYVAVSPFEAHFYAEFLDRIGVPKEERPAQMDRDAWPAMRDKIAAIFKTKTREQWIEALEYTNACVSPVLSLAEAPAHPQNMARHQFEMLGKIVVPANAPRLSRTPAPAASERSPPSTPERREQALLDWGFSAHEIAALKQARIVA